MKYMGSKRSMLSNGLGETLQAALGGKDRFVDLFCGAGSVSGHVASKFAIPVQAYDLQNYAVALTTPQVCQMKNRVADGVFAQWYDDVHLHLSRLTPWIEAKKIAPSSGQPSAWRDFVRTVREFCAVLDGDFPLTKAYGGHYFSHIQAMLLDCYRALIPNRHFHVCLAALIDAASSCAASPGHTAQPFSTNDSALPHLANSWSRCISNYLENGVKRYGELRPLSAGTACKEDAIEATTYLNELDLVFVDPPYSQVQYSRFYHVLEAVAKGTVESVSGVGRYPRLLERPQSAFCRLGESAEAFNKLMLGIAASGAEAVVTFPSGYASNGLSGELVEAISAQYFRVQSKKIKSLFSTLGGDKKKRNARMSTTELILHLTPV